MDAAPTENQDHVPVEALEQEARQEQEFEAMIKPQLLQLFKANRSARMINLNEVADSLSPKQPQTAVGIHFGVAQLDQQLVMFPDLRYTLNSQATKIDSQATKIDYLEKSQAQYQSSQEKLQEAQQREIQQLRKDGERSEKRDGERERSLRKLQDKLDMEIDNNQKIKEDNQKYLVENAKLRDEIEAQKSNVKSLEERLTRDEKDRSTLMELCREQQKEINEQRQEISKLTKTMDEIVKHLNLSVREPALINVESLE